MPDWDKRKLNREWSTKFLAEKGIAFVSHNKGAHLVVENRFDFWPGTGWWIERATQERGRGVRNLIKLLKTKPKYDYT